MPKLTIDEFAVNVLKNEISKKTGWTIFSKPDCEKLAITLLRHGYGQLSQSTIYRLFFQFQKHHPYKNTLDIISRFLGYADTVEFLEKIDRKRQEMHKNGIIPSQTNRDNLLQLCINYRALHPLKSFFENMQTQHATIKIDVAIALYDCLLNTPNTFWFFHHFSKDKYVREYLLEKLYDGNFRIKNYDYAYIKYLENANSELALQDYIFGNSVLFRAYFIRKNLSKARLIGRRLYETELIKKVNQSKILILPYIQFQSYYLWHLCIKKYPKEILESKASELIELAKELRESQEQLEQKTIFHTIAETFIEADISDNFQLELKTTFKDLFRGLPDTVYLKPLKKTLHYFDGNGLLLNRYS